MINLSGPSPIPTLSTLSTLSTSPTPQASALPTPAPSARDSENFSRSLDRVQSPRQPAEDTRGKPNPGHDGRTETNRKSSDAESKRSLDALNAMQRTAAARQTALRAAAKAADAAQAAEAAKAAKAANAATAATATRGGGTEPVSVEPALPMLECPAAEPTFGEDCHFPVDPGDPIDAGPADNIGGTIVIPPTILPADVPPPRRTLPAPAPQADRSGDAAGETRSAAPTLPPKLPPIPSTPEPIVKNQPSPWQPALADSGKDIPAGAQPPKPRPSGDSATDERGTKMPPTTLSPVLPLTPRPGAPLSPADGSTAGPSTLPALPPSAAARASTAESNSGSSAAQGVAAALAAMLPAPGSARSEALAQAQLPARPDSSEFAHQLGAQVAVWAKDGVQRASLQLNPLELGPVSVQIQLDGNGAQVMLAADLSATRQALEQALPTLAGSLREAGLTLTGGGVFDNARQQADARADAQAHGSGSGDSRRTLLALEAERAERAPLNAPRRRGVVDLMA